MADGFGKRDRSRGLGQACSVPSLKYKYQINHCSFYGEKLVEVERKGRSVVLMEVSLHGSMRPARSLVPLIVTSIFYLEICFSLSNITNLTKTALDLGLFSLIFPATWEKPFHW